MPEEKKEEKKIMLISEGIKSFRKSMKENFITLIVSAVGFVAAFSWNDAIKKTVEAAFPPGSNLIYSYFAAIAVTMVSITVIFLITKLK